MSFNKRSTNERVLARHHLKRLPQADQNSIHAVGGTLPPSVPAATLTNFPANTVALDPVVSVLPPIGTDSLPPSATFLLTSDVPSHTSTVIAPVVSSQSPPPSVSPTRSSVPPTSVTTPSVTPPSASPSSSSSTPAQVTSSTSLSYTSTTNRALASETSSPTAPAGSASASSKSGLSAGAVGGIVVVIVVLAVLAVGFFLRRRSRHHRNMRRNTWGAGLVPTLESKRDTVYASEPFTRQSMPPSGGVLESERLANVPRTTHMSQTHSLQGMPALPAPVSSYNNTGSPISPFVAAPIRAPSLRSSTVSSAAPSSEMAIVARTFIPSLPDELQIANGEQIRILNAYDDGWALCANFRGDQGVVPLECLDRSTSVPAEMQLQPQSEFSPDSNKTFRRLSSLTPNAAGTY